MQWDCRLRMSGNERRERVRVSAGDKLVEKRTDCGKGGVESNVVRIERVLACFKERDTGYDPSPALGLVEELAAEVSILAIAFRRVRVDDALLDVVIGRQEVLIVPKIFALSMRNLWHTRCLVNRKSF